MYTICNILAGGYSAIAGGGEVASVKPEPLKEGYH